MTTLENAKFANDLGHFYESTALRIAKHIHDHQVNDVDFKSLSNYQDQMSEYANKFFTLSDQIAFQNSDQSFANISAAKQEISKALAHIDKTNKIIKISGGIIALAVSVINGNIPGIASALGAIGGEIAAV